VIESVAGSCCIRHVSLSPAQRTKEHGPSERRVGGGPAGRSHATNHVVGQVHGVGQV